MWVWSIGGMIHRKSEILETKTSPSFTVSTINTTRTGLCDERQATICLSHGTAQRRKEKNVTVHLTMSHQQKGNIGTERRNTSLSACLSFFNRIRYTKQGTQGTTNEVN
jgi:hypothetical protein